LFDFSSGLLLRNRHPISFFTMGFYFKRIPKLADVLIPQITWRLPNTEKKIFLTFDDGVSDATPVTLHILNDKKIPATFFMLGCNAKAYPSLVADVAAAGHAIGNHGYSHTTGLSADEICREVLETADILGNAASTENFFRFPFGKFTPASLKAVRGLGFRIIGWSVMAGDFDPRRATSDMLKTLMSVRSGDILVLHDSLKCKTQLKTILPTFIDFAKAKGFTFSRIDR
jgi:peptidoglycan/xylan/chitin deacetylase (PgdA/CDA1 family)